MEFNGKHYYLGVDVGSISTNLAVINDEREVIESVYIRTEGKPIKSIQRGMAILREKLGIDLKITGAGATGSARKLTGMIVGADIVKNEITAHSLASLHERDDIQTIIEIGGQDSKIIIIRNGVAIDFAMNTVCAAGTGSFLDTQARRLKIKIEDFGGIALKSHTAVSIAGRCTVFAESDMIHKQQLGHPLEDILKGLCESMVRNYLNNVGKGKEILPPIMFQGGVAANIGIREAFKKYLKHDVFVPEHYDVMGAIGAAILALEEIERRPRKSSFYGWKIPDMTFKTVGFECSDCPNVCEVVEIRKNGDLLARWGSKCGKWDDLAIVHEEKSRTLENFIVGSD
ncbi:acyl-CoA dehydratase activase [Promethearchaeum syntrophicum]|uniref:Acyl-CoA dehydratase activase n=1 Tax=Promethearchaeum syntrophicum TaxID=2594042 RepID=A0A5B9D6K3_9ARCH|nr:acyl-CoA dehydratase activase [Candidatus Prometheoarchaeum syntrophicum]